MFLCLAFVAHHIYLDLRLVDEDMFPKHSYTQVLPGELKKNSGPGLGLGNKTFGASIHFKLAVWVMLTQLDLHR